MERLEWVGLAWHAKLGPAAFNKLLARFGSPGEVIGAGEEELLACKARLSEAHIAAIGEVPEALGGIAEELEALGDEGVRVVCSFEEEYPPTLAELPPAPPVVCISGELREEDVLPGGVAIVGTRSPSVEGMALAEELGAEFARHGVTVVSGLARGIDTAGHRGALRGGGRTVAVLGSGIRVIHPAENRPLAEEISSHGAVVSELSPRARPSVRTLMARNRLQSALSNGVIVVESQERGGSLQTAADARRQGRLLLAVDWPDQRSTAAGTRKLIAEGALAVRGPEDVAEVVRLLREHRPSGVERRRRKEREAGQLGLF